MKNRNYNQYNYIENEVDPYLREDYKITEQKSCYENAL